MGETFLLADCSIPVSRVWCSVLEDALRAAREVTSSGVCAMTLFKVRVTEAKANSLRARINGAGLQVEFQEEQRLGTLVLRVHDLSQAHTVREILASEGIHTVYDAD
jgi:hypothetical protein